MPDFPILKQQRNKEEYSRYDSRGDLTTRQPSAFVTKDTSGEITAAYGKIGDTVQDNAIKWSNAYDTMQKTAAEAEFKTKMADIQQRAANDPDPSNADQYFKEIEQAKKDSLKGFSSKYAENQMAYDLGLQSKVGNIQIENLYKKKAIDKGRVDTFTILDSIIKNPPDDLEGAIWGVLQQQVNAGIFSKEDGYKIAKEYIKNGKYNGFLNDTANDPQVVMGKLQSNEYNLDPQELAKAKKYYSGLTKKNKEAEKQQELQTMNDFAEKLVSNQLKPSDVQNAVAYGQMNADIGTAFELALSGPDKWRETAKSIIDSENVKRADIFIRPLLNLDKTSTESMGLIVKTALDNYNDRKINKDELVFVLRAAYEKNKKPDDPKWDWLKSSVEMVQKNFLKSPSMVKAGAEILQKFKEQWDFEEDARATMRRILIDQYKKDHPETASFQVGSKIKRKNTSWELKDYNDTGAPLWEKK